MKRVILLLILLLFSCDNRSSLDVMRDYILKEVEGKVKQIQLVSKGCIFQVTLENKKNVDLDGGGCEVLSQIKAGDYFKKFANTNKCLVIRKDSIMLLNCGRFTKIDRDSLGKIVEWNKSRINKWIKVKAEK